VVPGVPCPCSHRCLPRSPRPFPPSVPGSIIGKVVVHLAPYTEGGFSLTLVLGPRSAGASLHRSAFRFGLVIVPRAACC
jgi:hypothetical protein